MPIINNCYYLSFLSFQCLLVSLLQAQSDYCCFPLLFFFKHAKCNCSYYYYYFSEHSRQQSNRKQVVLNPHSLNYITATIAFYTWSTVYCSLCFSVSAWVSIKDWKSYFTLIQSTSPTLTTTQPQLDSVFLLFSILSIE